MSKTKILAFSALWAMLFSCGSQDGSPPELKNQPKTISPYDTLKVEFNSDLSGLDTSSIAGDAVLAAGAKSNELRFVGKNTSPGGYPHFLSDRRDASIEVKNLKNTDGYVKDITTITFSTYIILDVEPNNVEAEARDIVGDLRNGITFAGIIDKDVGETDDTRDFYALELSIGDNISITASSRDSLSVRFYGKCLDESKGCNNKTIRFHKTDVLQDVVKLGNFTDDDRIGTKRTFYIEVSDRNLSTRPNPNNPNPYLITIKVE
jgi:hypothetical protein